jgi:hypothetical protein
VRIINDPAAIADHIVRSEAAGYGHAAPLLRAAAAGQLAAAFALPGCRLPLRVLDAGRWRGPVVAVLAGDVQPSAGPGDFPQARRLLAWSRWTMLHGTGGEPWHYAAVVEAALRFRRVLLVECASATLPAWKALRADVAPDTPGLVIQPPPAGLHPHHAPPPGMVFQ